MQDEHGGGAELMRFSSDGVDIAFIAPNPPTPSSQMTASLPPHKMTSASSARIAASASPMLWFPVAHAETTQ